MENQEIWKGIEDYDGDYQVSNSGSVKSLKCGKERILKPHLNSKNYYQVALLLKRNIKMMLISRLVALAFIPNPENKRTVNHINGIKTDNRVENLEWATQSENRLHAYKIGLQKVGHGKDNHLSKPVIQLSLDNEYIYKHDSQTDASKSTGVYRKSISSACWG